MAENNTERNEPDDLPADRPEDQDRGISSVADRGNQQKVGLAIVGVALLIILAFWMLGSDGDDQAAQTADDASQEFTPARAGNAPQAPDLSQPLPPPTQPQQQAQQRQQRLAAQRESEAERRAEARRNAPVLIVDQNSGAAAGDAPSTTLNGPLEQRKAALQRQLAALQQRPAAAGGAFGTRGTDAGGTTAAEGFASRNRQFAQRTANQDVEVAHARRLPYPGYRINQGKLIHAVLETAINSDLPGLLRAVVTRPVYSSNGQRVLIRRGSRLVGQYRSGLARGQTRVFVVWNRVIQPNGVSIQIGSRGTDALGRAGMTGEVDTHFFKRFGSAMMLSIIGAGAQAAQDGNTVIIRTSESFSETAEVALKNSIDIPPTVHIDQGEPVKVLVARDLLFRAAMTR